MKRKGMSMAQPFVDRIEGLHAVVVVDGEEKRVLLAQLPKDVREGVYLTADLKAVDQAATEAALDEIAHRRDRVKKDDGGDFAL